MNLIAQSPHPNSLRVGPSPTLNVNPKAKAQIKHSEPMFTSDQQVI
jgi:hypothetical protein